MNAEQFLKILERKSHEKPAKRKRRRNSVTMMMLGFASADARRARLEGREYKPRSLKEIRSEYP